MRIISGSLKGRVVKGYDVEGTRPTMDRVKESVFSMIQNKVVDATVLDLFAGRGNLGIEAISNGSKICYFNDLNKECVEVINSNIKNFNIMNKCIVLNKDYMKCLDYLKDNHLSFDLIFLDPPYKMDCLNEVIEKILENNLIKDKGLLICEISHDYLYEFKNLEKIKSRKYGDKIVIILEK